MKNYSIYLNGDLIGTTLLEKADASMGVVFGQIVPEKQNFGYNLIKDYCAKNSIEIADDYPEDKLISTMTIESLMVKSESDIEIKGVGNQISGLDGDGFEITILGIAYPFYQEEFPHHIKEYKEMFKE